MENTRSAPYQERLIASGVRLTPQRFMVLEAIATQPGHTTAEQILARVQEHYPHVNKTTVYRTLELLSELGMVTITHLGGNQATYELRESPHHHLICKRCGVIHDLPDAALNSLRELIATEHGFQPFLEHFSLFGICQACQVADSALTPTAESGH